MLSSARGDASVLYTFFILLIVVVSATVVGVLVASTIRGSQDIAASAQAFYAADTAVEFGLSHFVWEVDYDTLAGESGDADLFCTVENDAGLAGLAMTTATFDVIVTGNPTSAGNAPVGNEDDNCPTPAEVRAGTRAVCVTAFGDAQGGTLRRRIESDTVPNAGLPTCR